MDLPSPLHTVTLRTPSNGSLRAIWLIRSSLQFNYIFVYYEVTVLRRRWTFDCIWRTTSFHCIVLYYIVQTIQYNTIRVYCFKALLVRLRERDAGWKRRLCKMPRRQQMTF